MVDGNELIRKKLLKKPKLRVRKRKMASATADGHNPKPIDRGFTGNFFYQLGMLLTRLGVKIEVQGQENLPKEAPYILAANHETYVDGMWLMSALPKNQYQKFCCIGADDLLTKHGYFGKVIMKVGRGIPVKRKGNPLRALITAMASLEEDNILLIHPEGTRSRNGKLGKIQAGACYISQKADVPLVPVFLDGAYNVFNCHLSLPRFRDPQTHKRNRIIIKFGKALRPNEYDSVDDMNQVLTNWLHKEYENKLIPNLSM